MRKFIFFGCVSFLIVCFGLVYKKREALSLWWALQALPPQWAKEQIGADFAPFYANGIDKESLDETFEKIAHQNIPAYRYRVVNGNIYRKPDTDHAGRATVYDKILKRLQRAKKLPSVDFILCVMDGVPEVYVPSRFWVTEKQAPLLCWAKKKGAPALVLIPDFLTTKESSWHKEIETVNEKYRSIPWSRREEKAFWRGTASDKIYTVDNYFEKPRFIISRLSQEYPEQVDAGFCKAPEAVSAVFSNLKMILGNTPVSGHLQYKYLPVLDGWMCTFPGFQWRLLSGSLCLKQESDEIQYFYSALKPFEHYVPIDNMMGDLLEKIQWAKEHDEMCRQISAKARAFALENLMPNQIYAYLYWVLSEYASLQTFDSMSVDSTWKRVSEKP